MLLITNSIKVCVLIRAYQSEKYIEDALNSVFRQNFHGSIYVKILYDEGSNDNTYEKIIGILNNLSREKMDIEIIRHPHTSPFRALLTYGLKKFVNSCDYFSILDYDCYWNENYLERAVNAIGNSDFLYSNPIIINDLDENIGNIGHIPILLSLIGRKTIILLGNFIDANGIIMSGKCTKMVIDKLELLSSKTYDWIFEDWAIGAIALYFCSVIEMKENLVYYRIHSNNITAGNEVANKNMTNVNRSILTLLGFKLLIFEKMNFIQKIAYFHSVSNLVYI